jgi:hypothetical protein
MNVHLRKRSEHYREFGYSVSLSIVSVSCSRSARCSSTLRICSMSARTTARKARESSSAFSRCTKESANGCVTALGNRSMPRPWTAGRPWRMQASASAWSRTPLIIYSACHGICRRMLLRACKAYSHAIPIIVSAEGGEECRGGGIHLTEHQSERGR